MTLRAGLSGRQAEEAIHALELRYNVAFVHVVGGAQLVPVAWSASLSPEKAAELRCDPDVAAMSHFKIVNVD